MEKDIHRYDDIIDLPHHVSQKHPQMSMHDRAAQFSSFAALTGYDDTVKEKASSFEKEAAESEANAPYYDELP